MPPPPPTWTGLKTEKKPSDKTVQETNIILTNIQVVFVRLPSLSTEVCKMYRLFAMEIVDS